LLSALGPPGSRCSTCATWHTGGTSRWPSAPAYSSRARRRSSWSTLLKRCARAIDAGEACAHALCPGRAAAEPPQAGGCRSERSRQRASHDKQHKLEAHTPSPETVRSDGGARVRRNCLARSGESPAALVQALARRPELRGGAWADLGTGSGARAVGLARLLQPGARVLAVECSACARAWAELNVRRLGLQAAVEVRGRPRAAGSGLEAMHARCRVSG